MHYFKLHIQVWAFLLHWQNYSWTLLNVSNMKHSNKEFSIFIHLPNNKIHSETSYISFKMPLLHWASLGYCRRSLDSIHTIVALVILGSVTSLTADHLNMHYRKNYFSSFRDVTLPSHSWLLSVCHTDTNRRQLHHSCYIVCSYVSALCHRAVWSSGKM
jgi:hypothetical protein